MFALSMVVSNARQRLPRGENAARQLCILPQCKRRATGGYPRPEPAGPNARRLTLPHAGHHRNSITKNTRHTFAFLPQCKRRATGGYPRPEPAGPNARRLTLPHAGHHRNSITKNTRHTFAFPLLNLKHAVKKARRGATPPQSAFPIPRQSKHANEWICRARKRALSRDSPQSELVSAL